MIEANHQIRALQFVSKSSRAFRRRFCNRRARAVGHAHAMRMALMLFHRHLVGDFWFPNQSKRCYFISDHN